MNQNQSNSAARTRAIRLDRVCDLTGASRSTIWRRVLDDPDFPKPFKLSAGITVWDEGEVFHWLVTKKKAGSRANARLDPRTKASPAHRAGGN